MRRTRRQISYRDIALCIFFLLGIVWFSYLNWNILKKEQRAQADVTDTKAELASLDSRSTTLSQNLSDLNTERGKEAVLRDTLGVAKPGENVIIVVPPASSGPATSTEPWWQAIFSWF